MHIPCQHHPPVDTHYTGANEKLVTLRSLDPVSSPDNDIASNHPLLAHCSFSLHACFPKGNRQ